VIPARLLASAAVLALGCSTTHTPGDASVEGAVRYCDVDGGPGCSPQEVCGSVGARRVCMASCGAMYDGEVCAQGRHCILGHCSPGGSTPPGAPCNSNLECVDGYICSAIAHAPVATCVPICVGMHYDDAECAAGTICTYMSACVPPCDPANASTCDAGQLCRFRECDFVTTGEVCLSGPCAAGRLCEPTSGMCVDPVTFDRLDPRPAGGPCHEMSACPANAH
jgi:hypothetical protein